MIPAPLGRARVAPWLATVLLPLFAGAAIAEPAKGSSHLALDNASLAVGGQALFEASPPLPVAAGSGGGADPSGQAGPTGRAEALLDSVNAQGHATLDDCFRIARALNERIGRSREDLIQAELLRKTALSNLLPQVSLQDLYYTQNPVTTASGVASTTDSRNEARINLTQSIFQGLRDLSYMKYTARNIAAYRYALDDSERQLYGDVALAFYSVLLSDAAVGTLRDTVTLEQERLREITARLEVGLARKTDVLLARSQLDGDAASLTGAMNAQLVTRQRLAFVMGAQVDLPLKDDVVVPGEGAPAGEGGATDGTSAVPGSGAPATSAPAAPPLDPAAPPAMPTSPEFEQIVSVAMHQRSDLKRLDEEVEGLRYQVQVARGAFLPSIGLEANWILDRWQFKSQAAATDWSAQVGFAFPIFTGGRNRANVASAQSTLRTAQLNRDELARSIKLEVRSRWLTLQSNLAQLRTQASRVRSADENYRLIQEEYRAGLATNLEVLAAQNQFLSARLDNDRQYYLVKLDQVGLEVAQGLLPAAP